jgi:superfamily I DNA/RNA helicase
MGKPFSVEQTAAVNSRKGYLRIIAVPGSGKTTVFVERVNRLLHEVRPEQILAVTFSKEGAAEMEDRSGIKHQPHKYRIFRTFHGWALDFICREVNSLPYPAEHWPLLTPLEASRLLSKVCRQVEGVKYKDAQDYIERMQRAGISPEQARERAEGSLGPLYAAAYGRYTRACRTAGQNGKALLDFNSVIYETVKLLENHEVRRRNAPDYLMIDEAQDTDACSPPGTFVRKCIRRHSKYGKSVFADVPIETLRDGDTVATWNRRDAKVHDYSKSISIGRREYSGDLIEISCGDTKTKVTPDHRVYAVLNDTLDDQTIVYLMFRHDKGFRIGQCAARYARKDSAKIFRNRGGKASMGGLVARFGEEKADFGWILSVEKTRTAAVAKEEIYSCNYAIPQAQYDKEWSVEIFKQVNCQAEKLLKELGLCFERPLFRRQTDELHGHRKVSPFKRYFETTAENLIAGVMSLPSTKPCQRVQITGIKRVPYSGIVYSLNVPETHTYVSDGIVVKNCQWRIVQLLGFKGNVFAVGDPRQNMYTWRGSEAEGLLDKFAERFPGAQTLPLSTNYRSTKAICRYLNEIDPYRDAGFPPITAAPNAEEGVPPSFIRYPNSYEEAKATCKDITDPENTAILCRTNRQLQAYERCCGEMNLKYRLLGKSGFFNQEEIKHVTDLIKYCFRPSDQCISRIVKGPYDPTRFLRKKEVVDRLAEMQRGSVGQVPFAALLGRFTSHDSSQQQAVRDLYARLQRMKQAALRGTARDGLKAILDIFGVLDHYGHGEAVDNDPLDNIRSLEGIANAKPTLADLLDTIMKALAAARGKKDRVTLSTVHQAKGKEWKYVYVAGTDVDVLPHKNGELKEEERIYFVACSRAAKRLYVTCTMPSPFIKGKAGLAELPTGNPDLLMEMYRLAEKAQ